MEQNNQKHQSTLLDYYGENVFNEKAMRQFLPYSAYKKLMKIISEGEKIDRTLAEETAHGIKEWAISKGASHFTHWFQPMTGTTAEKHDSFLNFNKEGNPIMRFSGKNLVQGEPDASSFPNGGIRSTFEARGYTAWDTTSPIFIVEGEKGSTLCIPTIFLSYTGEALDKKTPLLRSMESLDLAAKKILGFFGDEEIPDRIFSTVGAEQEYFLISKDYFLKRPDLFLTGRTLFGAPSPKGQQLDDHYFGTIKDSVLSFMQEVEIELYKLGIPAKTRHNEVAPSQYEIAPIFEESNIAIDHNQQMMEVMRKTANRHGLALLLHEKPFNKINGSGKHNNWSINASDGSNFLEPGDTPHQNIKFLIFLAATIKAVYKYSDLMRASISGIGNDHRLGANEAPPAIISIFLGDQLNKIIDHLLENKKQPDYSDQKIIDLGLSQLPVILKDNTDRNRTSPFAFTGNKFEFRAVGSSQSIAGPICVINSAVSSILNEFSEKISQNMKEGKSLNTAVMNVIIPALEDSRDILFEGNNYSPEWEKEAEKRNLPNLKKTPEALQAYLKKDNIEMFKNLNVFSERELESRYHIYLEQYSTKMKIEAETAIQISRTMLIPAAWKQQKQMAESLHYFGSVQLNSPMETPMQNQILTDFAGQFEELLTKTAELEKAVEKSDQIDDPAEKSEYQSTEVLNKMNQLRETADQLEKMTDNELWPLPKYREMLLLND